MATYLELKQIHNGTTTSDLLNRIEAAIAVKVDAMITAGVTRAQASFTVQFIDNPAAMATKLFWLVLGANSAATVAQIVAATDTAIQTNVDAAIDALVAQDVRL